MQEQNSDLFLTYSGMKILEEWYWQRFETFKISVQRRWDYHMWLMTHIAFSDWRRVNAKCLRMTPEALSLPFPTSLGDNDHDQPF